MATTQVSPPSVSATRTRRLSVLDAVILTGLLGIVVTFTAAQILDRAIIPPVLIESIAYLVCAGIVATGWRWSALVPLVIVSLGFLSDLASGFPAYALTHPSDYLPFATLVIAYALTIMVVGACIVKLRYLIRRETPHAPRWTTPALTALAGLALGALLIGSTAAPSTAGGSVASGAGTKTVHLTANRFSPDIVALHTGEALILVDDGAIPHTIANGTWNADNRPAPGAEPGAPVVDNVELDGNSVNLGTFATPGTYHVYCTIHPGMTLTIIVQ
jgi:plastocyanin